MTPGERYRGLNSRPKRPLSLGIVWLFLALPDVSHGQITLDGSLGPDGPLSGPDYVIASDLGQTRGSNLFHSFGEFNVLRGESATFTGSSSIDNVISRVTGGSASKIDGLLRSEIDGANLYLLNPSGVLFGPDARLEVSGSFHVSTADFVRFEDSERFFASPNENSVLSVNSPASFGFLRENPAGISLLGGALEVPAGQTLSLVGGDIEINEDLDSEEGAALRAPSGRITLVSVASPGEVVSNAPGGAADLNVESFEALGAIAVSAGATISTRGDPGGTVVIRAGRFMLAGSDMTASSEGQVDHPGVGIDIRVTEEVVLNGTDGFCEIASSSLGAGDAGDIRIEADTIRLLGGVTENANIGSRAFGQGEGAGDGGVVEIQTRRLHLEDFAFIQTTSFGPGNAGMINVNAETVELSGAQGPCFVSTSSAGSGKAGVLDVPAESVVMRGGEGGFTGFASQVRGDAEPGAEGGEIRLSVGSLDVLDGAQISAGVFSGAGAGGNIEIEASDARLAGLDPGGIPAGIFSSVEGELTTGKGGNIEINAEQLLLTGGAQIGTFANGPGESGDIRVETGSMEVLNGARVSAGIFSGPGNAGDVDVMAETLRIDGVDERGIHSGIYSDVGGALTTGRGGNISIASNDLQLTNEGLISTFSGSPGDSGNIGIRSGTLEVTRGAFITSANFGSGEAGDIELSADRIRLAGPGPPDGVTAVVALGGVFAESAGDIRVTTGSLEVLNGAQLTARTTGAGDGGTIELTAENVLIEGDDPGSGSFDGPKSGIFTSTLVFEDFVEQATGSAGDVRIEAGDLVLRDGGTVSAKSTSAGDGGSIAIQVRDAFHNEGGTVIASSEHTVGGDVTIDAGHVRLTHGALVSVESSGEGDAGSIDVAVDDSFHSEDSMVTTEARQADGGNIRLNARSKVHLESSEIAASVGGGAETVGGNINIDPEFVILDDSKIVANAFEGRGGNIEIVTDVFLADPASSVDASSERGIDGTVVIRSPATQIVETVTPLPKDFRSAVELLREPCMARIQGGRYGSLILGGRDGMPIEPGGLLPSPLDY